MTLPSHNPQSHVNGYISMMRNMIVASTVGLSLLVASSSFPVYTKIVQCIAFFVCMYSLVYGYMATRDYGQYIEYLKTIQYTLLPSHRFIIQNSVGWIWMTYAYMLVVLLVAGLIVVRKLIA